MMTKYGREIQDTDLNGYLDLMKNKTYKLLPLREENLPWKKHLETILIEISGFNKITLNEVKTLVVLSKLESLKEMDDLNFIAKQYLNA